MGRLLQRISLLQRKSKRSISHHEVTSRFLEFFKEQSHTIVPSSSLLAPSETGLLFTNSGMNQFHRILSGCETPSVKRVASLQDCIRVGGKHNDLLEVGHDAHHHTFFQMLGNWSFGDYFKDEACNLALQLLTTRYNLKKENLFITYFGGDFKQQAIPPDLETREVWRSLGISEKALLAKDIEENFWEMGQTGPCGPCTEIHVLVNDQLREIWNLVFVQYNRLSDGSLQPLATPFVDTGVGLERLCALLQGKSSNYETDLFSPLINYLEKESGKSYTASLTSPEDCAFRLVADHCRMSAKAVSQGILPQNEGAGNKVRRVLRRAIHAARDRLKLQPGSVAALAVLAADLLSLENSNQIKAVIGEEERRYMNILSRAENILQTECVGLSTMPGSTAWKLYQYCGLPRDNIADICVQRGMLSVDWSQFTEQLENFKLKSQGANPFERFNLSKQVDAVNSRNIPPTNYCSVYHANTFTICSDVLYASQEGHACCVVVTRETCFYPESGGQVSDTGKICLESSELRVVKVVKAGQHLFHLCEGQAPPVSTSVVLQVDQLRRINSSQHHTAIHLLNAAIKKQLGVAAVQKSSLVDDEHFRLDIMSRDKINVQAVEEFINDAIKSKLAVKCDEVQREDLMNDPTVIKLPNEVYPPKVRLVQCGTVSREPCCGTHVTSTDQISPVVILSARSAGANVRIVTATATRSRLALENAKELKWQISDLIDRFDTSTDNFRELSVARARISSLRKFVANELLPQLIAEDASKQLDSFSADVKKCIKRSNKANEKEVRSRLMALEGNPIVGSIVFDCDEWLVFRMLKELTQPYFCLLFSCDQTIIQCRIPPSIGLSTERWAESFVNATGLPFYRIDSSKQSADASVRLRLKASEPSFEYLERVAKAAWHELENDCQTHQSEK